MQQKAFFVIVALAIGATAVPANRCTLKPTKTVTSIPTCDTQLCVDNIDPCGQWYGGCFLAPECGGTWPTFTPPPCSLTITPTPTETVYPTTTTTTCDISICADYINKCGEMYGGCFLAPECGGTWPTFTPPPCKTPVPTCTYSICADYQNSCGIPYGGCFLAPQCGGKWPTFTPPPCPTKTSITYPTFCQLTSTICTDRYNPCEPQNIGTCYLNPKCGGTTLEPPNTICSRTTTPPVTTTTSGFEKVKRVVEWYTWTTTIPQVTTTINWDYGL